MRGQSPPHSNYLSPLPIFLNDNKRAEKWRGEKIGGHTGGKKLERHSWHSHHLAADRQVSQKGWLKLLQWCTFCLSLCATHLYDWGTIRLDSIGHGFMMLCLDRSFVPSSTWLQNRLEVLEKWSVLLTCSDFVNFVSFFFTIRSQHRLFYFENILWKFSMKVLQIFYAVLPCLESCLARSAPQRLMRLSSKID